MPPRFRYWTIVIDGVPTAFRARERAELIPTLRQIRHGAPGATLMWSAEGRLWLSPHHARLAARARPRPSTIRRPSSGPVTGAKSNSRQRTRHTPRRKPTRSD